MMNIEEKSDTEIVKEQTLFVRNIYEQLAKTGKVVLEADDTTTFEELSQTLNIFRMYLAMLRDNEKSLQKIMPD